MQCTCKIRVRYFANQTLIKHFHKKAALVQQLCDGYTEINKSQALLRSFSPIEAAQRKVHFEIWRPRYSL